MKTHRLDIRVYYEDTDAAGLVYHARYLAFAERARAETLRDAGVPHHELVHKEGSIFVVRRVKMDYLRPARLDDLLTVVTEPTHMGAATATLQQDFYLSGRVEPAEMVARLEVGLACVRVTDGRPVRIPSRWRMAFAGASKVPSGPAEEEVRSGSGG